MTLPGWCHPDGLLPGAHYGSYPIKLPLDKPAEAAMPPCAARAADAATGGSAAETLPGVEGTLPSVRDTFAGATVFITGGTGYVGSVLIEQLLRCVPELAAIQMLVRPKYGVDPADRIDKLLEKPLFDALRSEPIRPLGADGVLAPKSAVARSPLLPHLRAKLHAVPGDVVKPRCGLSDADYELVTRRATYVIHCAASISFTDPVQSLAQQNYVATRNVIELVEACYSASALAGAGAGSPAAAAAAVSASPHAPESPAANALRWAAARGGNSNGFATADSALLDDVDAAGPGSAPDGGPDGPFRGMVHVSTCYVNAHLPIGSHVDERIYYLRDVVGAGSAASGSSSASSSSSSSASKSSRRLDHAGTIAKILAEPTAAAADKIATPILRAFGFPNAYTFTKHLAEEAVADAHAAGRLRAVVVRPSIIGSIADAPAPGYFGNAAGLTQLMLAYASGMATFSAHNPNNVWDMVPCDTVCALIAASCTTLAAAAGVTAGAAPRVRAALAAANAAGAGGNVDAVLAAAARAARGEGVRALSSSSSPAVPLARKLSAALSRAASPGKAKAAALAAAAGATAEDANAPCSPHLLGDRRSSGSFGRAVSGGPAANHSNLLLSTPTTFINTSTVRDEPLVFHAATSVANPIRYGWLLINTIVPFFFDNPPRHRFYQGDYISIHRWSSFMPDNTLVFKLFVLIFTLKFFLISCLMKLKGLPKLADTVWQGWQAYSLYNSSRLDFQLFFCVRNAAKLQKLLEASRSSRAGGESDDVQQLGSGACAATTDAAATPVVWRGSWFKYINRHCEVVNARYFSEAAVAAATAGSGRDKAAGGKKAESGGIATAEGDASATKATGAQLSSSTTAKLLSSSKASSSSSKPPSVHLSLIPKPRGPPSAASVAKATAYLRERVGHDAFEDTTMGSSDLRRLGSRKLPSGGSGGDSPLASASPSPPATPNGKVAGGFEGGERAPLLGARSR